MTTLADAAPSGAVAAMTGGIAAGALIHTLSGPIPVERLRRGDRVITRAGARSLLHLLAGDIALADVVHITCGALGHDRPDQPLTVGAGQPLLLRDWRALALYGRAQASVPAARLADGEFLLRRTAGNLRLYHPVFAVAQTIYADGVELVCDPAAAPAAAFALAGAEDRA